MEAGDGASEKRDEAAAAAFLDERHDYPVCYWYCLWCMHLQLKSLQNS
jgi:hypothetical protein